MINHKKSSNQQHEGKFNFRRAMVSNWYVFVICIAAFAGLTFAYIQLVPPLYEVTGTVLLKQASGQDDRERWVQKQIDNFSSGNLISRSVSSFHSGVSYYTTDAWVPAFLEDYLIRESKPFPFVVQLKDVDKQYLNTLMTIESTGNKQYRLLMGSDANYTFDSAFGELLKADGLSLQITQNDQIGILPEKRYAFKVHEQDKLAKQYSEALEVAPVEVEGSPLGLLKLSLTTSNFDDGVEWLNQHIQQYKEVHGLNTTPLTDSGMAILDKQIILLQDSLSQYDNLVAQLKRDTADRVLSPDEIARKNSLNAALRVSSRKVDAYRALKRSLLRGENKSKSELLLMIDTDDLESKKLINDYFGAQEELDKLLLTVTESFPRVIRLKREIEKSRELLVSRTNVLVDAENQRSDVLRRRIAYLTPNQNVINLKDSLLKVEQTYAALRSSLETLMNNKSEASAANGGFLEVVSSPGDSPRIPVWPANYLYLLAILTGSLTSFLIIFLKKTGNKDIILDEDVLKRNSKVPLLGMISSGPENMRLIGSRHIDLPIFQSFKFVGLNLDYIRETVNSNVIGLTSSVSGEGRTFCSVNLSATVAEAGNKTLLINLDKSNQRLLDYLKVKSAGMSDYILGFAELHQIVQPSHLQNLQLVAAGNYDDVETERYVSRVPDLIEYFRADYDYIFVKTPPITESSIHFELTRYFDVNLFVLRYNYTRNDILEGINDIYVKKKVGNLYLLFNDVKSIPQREPDVSLRPSKIGPKQEAKKVSTKRPSEKSSSFKTRHKKINEPTGQRTESLKTHSEQVSVSQSYQPKTKEPDQLSSSNQPAFKKETLAKQEEQSDRIFEKQQQEESGYDSFHENKEEDKPSHSSESVSETENKQKNKPVVRSLSEDEPVEKLKNNTTVSEENQPTNELLPKAQAENDEKPSQQIKPNPLREEIERKRLAQMQREKQRGDLSTNLPETLGRVEAKKDNTAPQRYAKAEPSKNQHVDKKENRTETSPEETVPKKQSTMRTDTEAKPRQDKKNEDAEDFTPPGTILPHEEYEEPGFFNRLLGKKKKKKTVYKNPFA